MTSKIRTARLRAQLSQQDIAMAMNRTRAWLSYVERGQIPVPRELQRRILTTIARLAALKETLRISKAALVEDLQLDSRRGSSIR